ncbi:hypothetical protein MH117_04980 [Paenibacillus sp. ACRRX]|uniref:hypothetical protein n=1 Tax=Paenibacillus sp. ACRRX TaxID=2918206 RepID=UPI001EF6C9FA|nr:hypothetical protein [Paenibacillus sp. ACRRX]MCG7406764.1 hypothetical protein [Paenibacillus sp. ACRRX]
MQHKPFFKGYKPEFQFKRDWKEDWDNNQLRHETLKLCNNPIPTDPFKFGDLEIHHVSHVLDSDKLEYWLLEVKRLTERAVSLEIDARYWKGKYLAVCEETAREKQRADNIKEKYDSLMLMLKEATEVMTWRNTGDGVDQGIKMIYRWLLERSPESKSDKI